ncbi:MAG TPA: crosslink repair DNA glycosylase YcaQ family protein [Terrimicrobiaceae bacterium]|nr:crosslink repair DNA glycosylase YcaQ family protein [Terrimicrobiaceae bacterium]
MPNPIVIRKAHARRFLLAHLHLWPPRKLRGKQGVLDYIRRVNCIQYDPINVVGQNPHLVLQSRVRSYKPAMLNALLYEDRKLVDGFDKQMSIYPVEDWPCFTYYRERMLQEYMESERTAAAVKLVESVRKQLETHGPLSSLELDEDTRMDWWLAGSVRAVRIALDILLYGGKTIVHHRVGMRRYFALTERVLPLALIQASQPHASQEDYLEWHGFRRAGGLGLVDLKVTAEFGGMMGWRGGGIRAAITRLAEKDRLVPVTVEELPRQRFYVRRDDLPALEAAAKTNPGRPEAALIAPLDNLMWDLNVVEMLFNFRYAWEVYKPAVKRDYGYYVLPVLYSDRFVARIDPEFDRASKVFTVKNWWWEREVNKRDEAMLAAIGNCVADFARYLEADEIRLGPEVKREPGLIRALKR